MQKSYGNMKPLKVVVCDENPGARKSLYNICKLIKERTGIRIMFKEYQNGDELLFDMKDAHIANSVDILLLEIDMPNGCGLDIARKLKDVDYEGSIIFTTKSTQHWRDAFDVEAFNYITKDEDIEKRFVSVFMKAAKKAMDKQGRCLVFSAIGEIRKIEVESISHFEVSGKLVTVFYEEKSFAFISSLVKVESLLFDNENFMRVNRDIIVSIPHIVKLNVKEKTLIMLNGHTIPVAPKYIKVLKTALTTELI